MIKQALYSVTRVSLKFLILLLKAAEIKHDYVALPLFVINIPIYQHQYIFLAS